MQTVGVRDLKNNLSRHLKRVQSGERLVITDRGRSIATLSPVEPTGDLDWVHKMVEAGLVHWNGVKPTGATRPIKAKGWSASQMVIEDRR
jgi:prevent-host-death family protein